MSVFVTTMYRYGDREKHSYVLGVWSSSEVAMQAGQTEALWRAGKYEPEVTEWKVDANEFDDIGEQRLTPLALDGANAPDFQHEFPADVLDGDGVLPEPPRQ